MKVSRPDSNGWWNWYEGGRDKPERVLLVANGAMVASDDDLCQAIGGDPIDRDDNYWEGTDTTQEYMPGEWEKIEDHDAGATTMTPMSDERLAEIDDDMRQFGYVDNDMAAELLAEVHRLRDVPPEVAAAMEVFTSNPSVSSDSRWIEIMHKKQEASNTIAAHFTALFKKGA